MVQLQLFVDFCPWLPWLGRDWAENSINVNVDSVFVFDFHARGMPILNRLATVHSSPVEKQQTDRTFVICRLWIRIGVLNYKSYKKYKTPIAKHCIEIIGPPIPLLTPYVPMHIHQTMGWKISSKTKCQQQEAHQLVWQGKTPTKIRHKAVGVGIFGHFFRTSINADQK